MARRILKTNWNRRQLDDTNENFKEIYEGDFLREKSLEGSILKDETISTNLIKKEAIIEDKLAEKSVTERKISDKAISTSKYQTKSVTPEKFSTKSDLVDLSYTHEKSFIAGTDVNGRPAIDTDEKDEYVVIKLRLAEKGEIDFPYPGANVLTKGQFVLITDFNDVRTYMRQCRSVLDVSRTGWSIKTKNEKQYIRINCSKMPRDDKHIYLTYPKTFLDKVAFNAKGIYSLLDFEFFEDTIPKTMLESRDIQEKLTESIDIIHDSELIESKFISGYKINSDYTIDLLESKTNDVIKIIYPNSKIGKMKIYFENAGVGQQIFVADKNGRYLWQQNITNFPNSKRAGWTIKSSENYFEIDFSKISEEEAMLYVSIKKVSIDKMCAVVDGRAILNDTLSGESDDRAEIELLLPSFYPIVSGEMGYIYFDQILMGSLTQSYYLNTPMWSNKGNRASGHTLINVQSDEMREISAKLISKIETKSTRIVAVPKNVGAGTSKKVLICGESTTDTEKSEFYVSEVRKRFEKDDMNIELIGTRGSNLDKHEGRSGWGVGALRFLESRGTVLNPFYNPEKKDFDFAHYVKQNTDAAYIDYFVLRFGINDPNRFTNSAESFIEHYNFIRNNVLSVNPNVKFIFEVTMSMARTHSQITHASRFEIMQRNKELLEEFQGRELEGIYVSNAYLNVDPINDYPLIDVPVSIYSEKTEVDVEDATHPNKAGQQKQADVTYWILKYVSWKNN